VFYVATPGPFNFTIFPVTFTGGAVVTQFTPTLYSLPALPTGLTGNEWATTAPVNDVAGTAIDFAGNSEEELAAAAANPAVDPNFVGEVAHYSFKLAAGFYVLDLPYAGT
jgi:hypothetical protein